MHQLQDTENLFNNTLSIHLQYFFLNDILIEYLYTEVTDYITKNIFTVLQDKLQLPLFHGTSFYFKVPQ